MSDSTASPNPGDAKALGRGRVRWMPGIVFVLLGLGLLVVTVVLARETQAFLSRASRAPGVVVDMRHGNQHPSVEFALPTGEKVVFPAGGWLSGYRLHQRVFVLYEADAPLQSAQLDDPGATWFAARFAGFLGTGQLLVGLLAMFVRPKNT